MTFKFVKIKQPKLLQNLIPPVEDLCHEQKKPEKFVE